jgi:hypothetical protein
MVQSFLDIKAGLIGKITKVKRAGEMVQAVTHLPSKHKVLSSNYSTTKTSVVFSAPASALVPRGWHLLVTMHPPTLLLTS